MQTYSTLSEAYLMILRDILEHPEYISSPRGMKIHESLDVQYRVMYPSPESIVTRDAERNKIIADYTARELEWYKSGDLSVESAEKISKFWKKLANPDGTTINSNYGNLIFFDESEGNTEYEGEIRRSPYVWALESLKKDKDSRQAVVRINKSKHAWDGNKDFVCTMYMIFHIRDDMLHISLSQRSCDMRTGFVFDTPFFAWVQQEMLKDLREVYPDLKLGFFTHTINSCHIYEKDIDSIRKMIE
jgi:thymidylate synthase